MTDIINVDVTAPASIAVGGEVAASGGYSTDPTYSINTSSGFDDAYSFILYNLSDLPSYAVDALKNGSAALRLTFQASTSDIIPVTVSAYAADAFFPTPGTKDPYVDFQVATPSSDNAASAAAAFSANSGSSIAQVTIKDSVGPAFPSENENTPQTVDITSQALATLANGDSQLVVYFHESGATSGYSVNVTNVSASVVARVFSQDSFSNSSTTDLVGSITTNPFANVTVTSQLPANLTNSGNVIPINPISSNATSTDFIDASTAISGSNDYLILQSNSASGTLSGQGLTIVQALQTGYVPAGEVGYTFSGTAAQATALLQSLVFTPSAAGPSQTKPTSFSIEEAFGPSAYEALANLNSIEIDTGSVAGKTYGDGTTQLVTTGGIANQTTLTGYDTLDASGARQVYGMQTVTSGGVANGTDVSAGIVTVLNGGTTNDTVLEYGGKFGINSLSSPSQENVSGTGIANRTSIAASASQTLTAGGLAFGTTINSGGLQTVGANSSANATHILSGGVETVASGGSSDQAVIDLGGRQDVSGIAKRASVSGVQNDSGATSNTTVQAGGKEIVASGATADSTSVTGAGAVLQLNSGATATRVTTDKGGAVTADGTVTLAGLSGDGTLTKTGAGVLTLSGASAFIGSATVSNGTLAVASDNSLGDRQSTIVLARSTLEVGDKFRSQGAVTVQNAATIQVDGGLATLSGGIGGTGPLFKTGGGTLLLSGANTFTGGITLKGGTLELANAAAAGTGGVTFVPGGEVLKVDGTAGVPTPIANFDAEDTLDVAGLSYTPGASATLTGTTLVVTSGSASETFTNFSLAPGAKIGASGNYALSVTSDGSHGSALTLSPVAQGTGSNGSYVGTIPAPSFAGVVAGQSTPSTTPIAPFGTVTLADSNPGATETITLTQFGPGVLFGFTGPYTSTPGYEATAYTFSGTAAAVTSMLEGLVFAPATGTPGPSAATTFTLSDASSAGSSASAGTIIVTATNPAVAPAITLTSAPVASNQATQTITGTVVSGGGTVVGQIVTLTDNNNTLGTATVAPDGSFTTNVILPNQGANAIVATVTDSYGNVGTSAAVVDTLDSIAPTITLTSTRASILNASNFANRTINGVVTSGGAASVSGQTVTLTDNGKVLGTATVVGNGLFMTNVVLPNQGANSIVATVRDSYGNTGTSGAFVDTLHSLPPTIAITSAAVAGNQATQTIIGTVVSGGGAITGQTVTLVDNSTTLGTATVAADGSFKTNVILPNQGANAIVATVTDSYGMTGSSAAVVDTLDSIAPTIKITSAAEASNVAGQTISGTVVSGGAASVIGQTVTLTDNSTTLGTATVAADGSFKTNVVLPNQGANSIVASVTDSYGNVGTSAAVVDTLDSIAPTIKITSSTSAAILNASNFANRTINGVVTSGGVASVSGQTVTLTDNGKVLGTATVTGNGLFSTNVVLPNQGANSIVATVADSYGNTGTSGAFVDTLHSLPPTIAITSAAVAGNQATQTIIGTVVSGGGAITGQTVTLVDNSTTLGTATVAADGSFKTNVILPNQGANAIVATVTDSYGMTGSSAAVVDTLDSIAPTIKITSAVEASNVAGQTVTGTVTSGGAALVSGQTVTLTDNGKVLGTATVAANGSFTTNVVLPNLGANSIVATVSDSYGNKGTSTAVVDTLDPGPVVGTTSAALKLGSATNLTASILAAAKPGLTGDTLTLAADNTAGTAGSVSLVNGQLVYTASGSGLSHIPANGSQTDSFGYTISDQYGDKTTGTETITVTNPANVINGPFFGYATIQGTAGADIINASGIFNTIYDNGGNDVVNAGSSFDTVYTGNGDVVVNLSGIINSVTGGDGNNTISGSTFGTNILLGNGNNNVSTGGLFNAITVGSGTNTINAGSGLDTVVTGAGFDVITLGGMGNSVFLNGSTAAVTGGQGTDTITVNGGRDALVFAGSNSQANLSGVTTASITDLGNALRINVGSTTQTDTIGGFGTSDTFGIVDFKNGAGGFTSTQAIVNALHSDGHGGTMLALGATGSIDFAGTAPNQLHASNFAIG